MRPFIYYVSVGIFVSLYQRLGTVDKVHNISVDIPEEEGGYSLRTGGRIVDDLHALGLKQGYGLLKSVG